MPPTLIGLDVQLLASWIIVVWTIVVIALAIFRGGFWRRAP